MKTLADFKRDLTVGRKVRLLSRYGKEVNEDRTVLKVQSNSVCFENGSKKSWLDLPKSTLLEYDGKTAKIYAAGYRDLTDEERRVIANEPRDKKQDEIDMMTDGNIMFWRRKRYYKESGKFYLFGTERQQGKRLTRRDGKKVIEDDRIKGDPILVYEIGDGNAEAVKTAYVHYTIQKCKKCGRDVKIDAEDFLMNLGEKILCKECKK